MTDRLKTVFMGSAPLSCASLEVLARRSEVRAVVTQPERPSGRGRRREAGPVRRLAEQLGLEVLAPERVNQAESVAALQGLAPDLVVVVAYGQILRPAILELPPLGCVNVHTSLLPRYRGAAPIQWAIANGERQTGVTTMYMAPEMDAGDIILQRAVEIGPGETAGELHDRLAGEGARLLEETLDCFERGAVPRRPQDESQVTLAPRLKKEDGRIDWARPAAELANRVRGFNPWPGSYCTCPNGSRLKVWTAVAEDGAAGSAPGTILGCGADGARVATGRGVLRLAEVQPEGGVVMKADAYACGHAVCAGDRMG